MIEKKSYRDYNNRFPLLSTEQYNLNTNWISGFRLIVKKLRAIHLRYRGHNNKQRQQHQQHYSTVSTTHQRQSPEPLQHQHQPLDQPRDYRHQQSKNKIQSKPTLQ